MGLTDEPLLHSIHSSRPCTPPPSPESNRVLLGKVMQILFTKPFGTRTPRRQPWWCNIQKFRWKAANKKNPVFSGSLFATWPWRCNYPTESDQNPCSRRLIFHENRPSRNSTLGIGKLHVLQVLLYSKHSSLAGLNRTNSNIRMKKGGTIETIGWNDGCPPKKQSLKYFEIHLQFVFFKQKCLHFGSTKSPSEKNSVSR